MEATISELPLLIDKVLEALERNEKVTLTKDGEVKGTIVPSPKKEAPHHNSGKKMEVTEHPMFGCMKDNPRDVDAVMDELRKDRFDDL